MQMRWEMPIQQTFINQILRLLLSVSHILCDSNWNFLIGFGYFII